jgi:hypothetical protein
MEYAVQAWRPWLQGDIKILANVQRRSTKLVEGMYNVAFKDREILLNLFPLHYRQTRGDLILAFKIIRTENYPLRFDDFFQLASTTHLRGHPWKLQKFRSQTLMRRSFFSQRVVDLWNSLPEFVVASDNVDIFKSRLDKFMANQIYS